MILLVNVNNSETSLAVAQGPELSRRLRLETRVGPTPDQWGMALEQLVGRAVVPRSDIFALGGVLYEMVSGRRAFEVV